MNANRRKKNQLAGIATLFVLGWLLLGSQALAQIQLASLCRVKGQEDRVLVGQGLIVGLSRTGDGGDPKTQEALAAMFAKFGGQAASYKNFKNSALVMVMATIPASGVRQGDRIDCVVMSPGSAKSLEGGRLLPTPMCGPQLANGEMPVFAMAQGPIRLEDPEKKTSGRINNGCRMEADFFNPFVDGDQVTLVLNEDHSGFMAAHEIATQIDQWLQREMGDSTLEPTLDGAQREVTERTRMAIALDQNNILVKIPRQYHANPAWFVAQLLQQTVGEPQTEAMVRINERTKTIIVTGDVEIGPVIVSHRSNEGIMVEVGGQAAADRFVKIQAEKQPNAKLESLLTALNAIKAPPEAQIDILKELARTKKLYAKLEFAN